jgi:hypothetical protein
MQLENIIQSLQVVTQSSDNPYRTWLSEAMLRNRGKGAILIRDSRLIGLSESHLTRNPATRSLSVITPMQLTKDKYFEVLYVLGATRWFPTFVFDAPRAQKTEIARYSWIKDHREPAKTFLGGTERKPQIEDDSHNVEDSYDAADILPVVDWRSIGEKISSAELQNTLESVEARLVLLEGDCAVFLESADGASVLTIDLDADESTERIERIAVKDVRPGTFLLLRSSGGGDYIVMEADRFLKGRASQVRKAQQRWKALLRQEVETDGLLGVSLRLLDLGSTSAEELNVRNYLSPRSIRTRNPEDFRAIMRLIGLGQEWEQYWDMMGEIDHAHRLAGQAIRRQLLRELEKLDLTQLERVGRMDITLPEVDAGGLTAFRVLDISPSTQLVSAHRIGHPFEL